MGVDGTRTIPQPDMRMVVPRKDLNIEHWWPHFTGTDYGFTISAAASYLFVRVPKSEFWPNGRVYVVDEVVRRGDSSRGPGEAAPATLVPAGDAAWRLGSPPRIRGR